MEWVPVIEKVGFPVAMVLILVAFITATGGYAVKFLWEQFFLPVKDGMMESFRENSETNQAILKRVEECGHVVRESSTKLAAMESRQSGFHEFLQKAGGYGMLMTGAGIAKDNGEKLDRIEKKVDKIGEEMHERHTR